MRPSLPYLVRTVVLADASLESSQWGNLLVLSAVYKDPILKQFVSEPTMRDLLSKTIDFFKVVVHASSALSVDLKILIGLRDELFYPS